MDRRDFLKYAGKASLGAGAALLMPRPLSAQTGSGGYDLVGVYGAEPYRMVDRAIQTLGGIGNFVKRGDTVLLKPNASFNLPPEKAATTNPRLVGRVIELCLQAGASRVHVTDHVLDSPNTVYDTNRIGYYVNQAGGTIVPASDRGRYQEVSRPQAGTLKRTMIHEALLEADVFINMPVLKQHGGTRISCAMKNYIGLIWNQIETHRIGLNQAIADLPLYRKPDLNIIDAYDVLMSGGPYGASRYARVERKHTLIASPDIVAADTAAILTWGTEPSQIPYVAMAERHGLGSSNLERLNISRITM